MSCCRQPMVSGSIFFVVLIAILALTWPSRTIKSDGAMGNDLLLYCAAGLRDPVQAIITEYQQAYGVYVDVQYGGSGAMLSSLEITHRGDVYIAADAHHMDLAVERGLVQDAMPIARQHLVLVTLANNAKHITTLTDLTRPDVRAAYANPEVASAGKTIKKILEHVGLWDAAKSQAAVFKPTVTEVINDVILGAVDVGVVWDPLVAAHPQLKAIHIPALDQASELIQIGVLSSSTQTTRARHFARFLSAQDRGQLTFKRSGYQVEHRDKWADQPSLSLYCGNVNRVAIEQTIRDFEQREGCLVQVNYNGSGMLVTQMNMLSASSAFPDVFLASDVSFLAPVAERFSDRTLLSETAIVIVVPQANPHGIRTLHDFTNPGLRLGLCHAEQSALGALTDRMLKKLSLTEAIRPNVRLIAPTADLLLTQLQADVLDAVIVYAVNAQTVPDAYTAMTIDLPEARAIQSCVIAKQTQYPQLAQRLLQTLQGQASRQRFLAAGFRWQTP